MRRGPGSQGLTGLSLGIPGSEAPSGALSRRSLQHGGAWRGPCHSCSAARAPRGRLRPLPALPGSGHRIPGHVPAGWDTGDCGGPEPSGGARDIPALSHSRLLLRASRGIQEATKKKESGFKGPATVISPVSVDEGYQGLGSSSPGAEIPRECRDLSHGAASWQDLFVAPAQVRALPSPASAHWERAGLERHGIGGEAGC